MANFLLTLVTSFTNFVFIFMSITSYFILRNTKATNNDPTPQCSPLLLASSASTTVIPATQVTPLKPGKGQGQQQLAPILVTNPTVRASRHGGEPGKEEDRNKAATSTKKQEPSWEMECTLLITPTRLFHPEPPSMLQMMTLMQIIHKLHVMKQKAAERKR